MDLLLTLLNGSIILLSIIVFIVLIIKRQKKKKKSLMLLKHPVFPCAFFAFAVLYLDMIYVFYSQDGMTISRYIIVGWCYMIVELILSILGYYNLHYSITLADGKIYVTKLFKTTIYDGKDITDIKWGFFIKFYKGEKKIFQLGGKDNYESSGFRYELRKCIPMFDDHFKISK